MFNVMNSTLLKLKMYFQHKRDKIYLKCDFNKSSLVVKLIISLISIRVENLQIISTTTSFFHGRIFQTLMAFHGLVNFSYVFEG